MAVTQESLIEKLGLEPHVEGGYYKRTFQADHREKIATPIGHRFTMTSIHYLLTASSPIGHWHLNKSDILHFFHLGSPITYYILDPAGEMKVVTLGPDPNKGHQLQVAVKGSTWKASFLEEGEFGLISEAVAPGFEYEDMTLAKKDELVAIFPGHQTVIERFTRN